MYFGLDSRIIIIVKNIKKRKKAEQSIAEQRGRWKKKKRWGRNRGKGREEEGMSATVTLTLNLCRSSIVASCPHYNHKPNPNFNALFSFSLSLSLSHHRRIAICKKPFSSRRTVYISLSKLLFRLTIYRIKLLSSASLMYWCK